MRQKTEWCERCLCMTCYRQGVECDCPGGAGCPVRDCAQYYEYPGEQMELQLTAPGDEASRD